MGMVLQPMFAGMAPGARRAFFAFALVGVCLLFAFPVLWLILTSLRPESGVYYVHRGTEFTADNFHEVLAQEIVLRALFNSFETRVLAFECLLSSRWSPFDHGRVFP